MSLEKIFKDDKEEIYQVLTRAPGPKGFFP